MTKQIAILFALIGTSFSPLAAQQGSEPPIMVPLPISPRPLVAWGTSSCRPHGPGVAHAFNVEDLRAALKDKRNLMIISRGIALRQEQLPPDFMVGGVSHIEATPLLVSVHIKKDNLSTAEFKALVNGERSPKNIGISDTNELVRNRSDLQYRSLNRQITSIGAKAPKTTSVVSVFEAPNYDVISARARAIPSSPILGFLEPSKLNETHKVAAIDGFKPGDANYLLQIPIYVYIANEPKAKKLADEFKLGLEEFRVEGKK